MLNVVVNVAITELWKVYNLQVQLTFCCYLKVKQTKLIWRIMTFFVTTFKRHRTIGSARILRAVQ